MLYNDTVTIFNRYVDSFGETMWYPHVLHNVRLIADKSTIINKYGPESNDNAILNVKFELKEKEIFIDNLIYLSPKEWEQQTNDKLAKTITFSPEGTNFDFFILGEYNEEPIFDEKGRFFSEMQKEYDYVFVITSVSKFDLIPHFEITGK